VRFFIIRCLRSVTTDVPRRHHMVTAGGEGQFYITDPTQDCYAQLCVNDYSFNGGAGEDFVADLGIKDLDFAVYHMRVAHRAPSDSQS
jgi:hypothetical protein